MAPDDTPDPVAVARRIVRIFGALNVRYIAAGSLASSLHGEPRSTNDIDLVADLRAAHIPALVAELGAEWVWNADVARDAVASGGSFNIIHASTAVKVDIFVAANDEFDHHRIASGVAMRVAGDTPADEIVVDTAEHTVLRKLEWFKRGGAVSDRQWRDVVNVLRAQGDSIDGAELDRWAPRLGVAELLATARREARE